MMFQMLNHSRRQRHRVCGSNPSSEQVHTASQSNWLNMRSKTHPWTIRLLGVEFYCVMLCVVWCVVICDPALTLLMVIICFLLTEWAASLPDNTKRISSLCSPVLTLLHSHACVNASTHLPPSTSPNPCPPIHTLPLPPSPTLPQVVLCHISLTDSLCHITSPQNMSWTCGSAARTYKKNTGNTCAVNEPRERSKNVNVKSRLRPAAQQAAVLAGLSLLHLSTLITCFYEECRSVLSCSRIVCFIRRITSSASA